MGAAELANGTEQEYDAGSAGSRTTALAIAPDSVEVRRNRTLLGAVGVLAAAVAVLYVTRALSTGAALDWGITAVLGAMAAWYSAAVVDSRAPLLVADAQGVRSRRGRTWTGLTWGAIGRIEHVPARGPLRDGWLVLVPRNTERWGKPLSVPLGVATRASHAGADLTDALRDLAGLGTAVVETVPGSQPRVRIAEAIDGLGERLGRASVVEPASEASGVACPEEPRDEASRRETTAAADDPDEPQSRRWAAPLPLRVPRLGRRTEVSVDLPDALEEEHDVADDEDVARDASYEDTKVRPIARPGDAVEPLEVPEDPIEPAPDPVIGPELTAARTRLGLSVDQLAERTRIRAHVIEAMEVDDFEPCGGDFYARGHLRTLSRVLGVEVTPLLAAYDERYSHAPVDPRRVFAADRTGGSIRGTRGGPNWSVLIAAVMALVLAWSIARLLMDSPAELRPVPGINGINGSGGLSGQAQPGGESVPVLLRAAGGGATVTVKDGNGKVVFTGDIAYGQTRSIKAAPPVKVQSSDGSVEVVVDGAEKGRVGEIGEPADNTYVVR